MRKKEMSEQRTTPSGWKTLSAARRDLRSLGRNLSREVQPCRRW